MPLQVSEQAFWDVDFNKIKDNEEKYASWIIQRYAHHDNTRA